VIPLAFWPGPTANDLKELGQGVSVGLEDAAALATLFPSGTKPSEIPSRLKAFEQIRKPRAERVSQMSSSQGKPSPNECMCCFPCIDPDPC
jgi:hypothetical protein